MEERERKVKKLLILLFAVSLFAQETIVFGEGSGQTGGDHKDTWLNEGATARGEGSNASLAARNSAGGDLITFMRFSLTGHIPTNAIINSSILTLKTSALAAWVSDFDIGMSLIAWGITPTDEGITANPALAGQATFRRSIDFNGAGGDVTWTGGGNVSSADYAAAEATVAITNPTGSGTVFNLAIPVMTRLWVANNATNYGLVIVGDGEDNRQLSLHSQEAVSAADRPYLTVTYTLPVISGQKQYSGQSYRQNQYRRGVYRKEPY